MGAQLIDGFGLSEKIREKIKKDVNNLKKQGITPKLDIVMVEGPNAYPGIADLKLRACKDLGIICKIFRLAASSSEEEIISFIEKLNESKKVHGINLHPMPIKFDIQKIYSALDPKKDVEGLHPSNLGNFVIGKKKIVPFTPLGVMELIESTGVDLEGKRAVIIGRSDHVGKPLAFLLLEKNATVSLCHSRTKKISQFTKEADILIVAIGHPERVPGYIIKPGAVVIDIGLNLVGGHIVGDVEFETAKEVAAWITPVPGGVGPMTVTMMLKNLISATQNQS